MKNFLRLLKSLFLDLPSNGRQTTFSHANYTLKSKIAKLGIFYSANLNARLDNGNHHRRRVVYDMACSVHRGHVTAL